jgi:hypothetical protein
MTIELLMSWTVVVFMELIAVCDVTVEKAKGEIWVVVESPRACTSRMCLPASEEKKPNVSENVIDIVSVCFADLFDGLSYRKIRTLCIFLFHKAKLYQRELFGMGGVETVRRSWIFIWCQTD